jgi:hypothetical protein
MSVPQWEFLGAAEDCTGTSPLLATALTGFLRLPLEMCDEVGVRHGRKREMAHRGIGKQQALDEVVSAARSARSRAKSMAPGSFNLPCGFVLHLYGTV